MKRPPKHDGHGVRRETSLPFGSGVCQPAAPPGAAGRCRRSHLRFSGEDLKGRLRFVQIAIVLVVLSYWFAQGSVACAAEAPTIAFVSPSDITLTSARLTVRINPNGSPTSAQIEYGPTANYTQVLGLALSPADGTTFQEVSVTVTGLAPRTDYHYRVTATSPAGAASTLDTFFSTLDNSAPSAPALSNNKIAENQPPGTVIGSLGSGVDPDGDAVTYTLVAGEGSIDNQRFFIDGTLLKSLVSFDFEAVITHGGPTYRVRVRASDAFGGVAEKSLPVWVTDVIKPQNIDFDLPSSAAQTDTIRLYAWTNAGPMTLTVASGPAEISPENLLSFTGSGEVTIRASQAGNPDYLPIDVSKKIWVFSNRFPALTNDAVTITDSDATLNPLANDEDPDGDELTITGVSDPSIAIKGRQLVIPAGFTGYFTYDAADFRGATSSAFVTVIKDSPDKAAQWTGLLFDDSGAVSGIMRAHGSPGGAITVRFNAGTTTAAAKLTVPPIGSTTAPTKAGTLTVRRDFEDRLVVAVGSLTGRLRPSRKSTDQQQHSIALASIDRAIAGGGTARVRIAKDGAVSVTGRLPDGTPFSTTSQLADNNTFVLYRLIQKKSTGVVFGGECVLANLPLTDITGELLWAVRSTKRGPQETDLNTVLAANGCLYTKTSALPSGSVTITATLEELSSYSVTTNATDGIPERTEQFPVWRVNRNTGAFTATFKETAASKPLKVHGLYLPKSANAWGYIEGSGRGGRLVLSLQAESQSGAN